MLAYRYHPFIMWWLTVGYGMLLLQFYGVG